ncbi:MAG TPA: radical SAM protein [Verrucomicrobiae bacterium]|nr:radical SAM protein [Verrucomicrobiae bacterium]
MNTATIDPLGSPAAPRASRGVQPPPGVAGPPPAIVRKPTPRETAFGCPRQFLDNRFVYVVVSPRAHGLSIGVNMNPDKRCNFGCIYCEADRSIPSGETRLDVEIATAELTRTLALVLSGQLQQHPYYAAFPPELLQLRHVLLSGDGEPTLCPDFGEALEGIIHVRAQGRFPFFKIVLATNATGLDLPQVRQSFKFLTRQDEIWAKLDAGTEAQFQTLNVPEAGITLEKILSNILLVGRQRPIIIQSLFPNIDGNEPTEGEIEAYTNRLRELKEGGAQVSLVQIYSATRPVAGRVCSHLPLKVLSRIAQIVRLETGLRVEVY